MKVEIVAKAKEDANSAKFKDLMNLMKDGINNVGFLFSPSTIPPFCWHREAPLFYCVTITMCVFGCLNGMSRNWLVWSRRISMMATSSRTGSTSGTTVLKRYAALH